MWSARLVSDLYEPLMFPWTCATVAAILDSFATVHCPIYERTVLLDTVHFSSNDNDMTYLLCELDGCTHGS